MTEHNPQTNRVAAAAKFRAFQNALAPPPAAVGASNNFLAVGSGGVFAGSFSASSMGAMLGSGSVVILGTGGVMTDDLIRQLAMNTQRYYTATNYDRVFKLALIDVAVMSGSMTIADRLNAIKNKFGLSMAGFASALHVSRPSLYSWLEGEIPRDPEVLKRIEDFYKLSMRWEKINPVSYPPRQLLRQPLKCGYSFRTLLENDFGSISSEQALNELADLARAHESKLEERRTHRTKNEMSKADQHKNRLSLGKTISFE